MDENVNGSQKQKTLLNLSIMLICCSLPILMGSTVYNSLILPEDEQRTIEEWFESTVWEIQTTWRLAINEKRSEKPKDTVTTTRRESWDWKTGSNKPRNTVTPRKDNRKEVWDKKETEYSRSIKAIQEVWISSWIATHIAWECYKTTEDPKLCIKNVLGVASAESSIFQHCYVNNCFWRMIKWDSGYYLKPYSTIIEWVSERVALYQKNMWFVRDEPKRWIKGKYCTSGCENRVRNFKEWTKGFNY